jgi:hypothetical protein
MLLPSCMPSKGSCSLRRRISLSRLLRLNKFDQYGGNDFLRDFPDSDRKHDVRAQDPGCFDENAGSSLTPSFHSQKKIMKCILLLGVVAFLIYAQTSPSGVLGGDSGELMAMVCNGGVAHPPGYPLMTMLGRAWLSAVPSDIGTSAFRLSLLSGAMHSAAIVFVSLAAKEFSGGTAEGLLAGGIFGFAPVTWKYSQQFEVFALNNLVCSILILLTAKYLLSGKSWIPYAGALFCGLGIANQHTIILSEAILILAVVHHNNWAILRSPLQMLSLSILFLLAAALPYMYLPIAGKHAPLGSWGELDTIPGFVKHVTRKEYGTFQLYTTGTVTGDSKNIQHDILWRHTRWVYVCMCVYG